MSSVFRALILASWCSLITASKGVKEFANSNAKFTSDIYTELILEHETAGQNIIASPLSAQIVLILTKEGARGITAGELSKVLSLPSKTYREEIIRNLPRNVSTEILTLNLAIKLYVAENFDILPSFLNLARNIYQSDVQNIDFSNNIVAADLINQWVADRTDGTIDNLIDPNQIDILTKFVLINALYFKGQWTIPFYSQETRLQPFYPSSCNDCINSKMVNMMNSVNNYLFFDCNELEAKFLELTYRDSDISMTFVLPHERNGLTLIESNIVKYLQRQNVEVQEVAVSIPRFNISSLIDFKPILENLGVHQLFEDSADLTGISSQKGLYVQYVMQKAFIGVFEFGTEAAAATGVIGGSRSFPIAPTPPPKLTFNADHPFFYYVRDNHSGVILFLGRYIN